MSMASIILVLKLVAEGVGVAKEIADLARRVQAGEEITDAEISVARMAIKAAVSEWDAQRKQQISGSD